MSDKDTARRTLPEVAFAGIDITSSMRQYLRSITYTDNEENETDDLQIRLHDRENVWLTQWLGDAVNAAVSTASEEVEIIYDGVSAMYKVTANSGLNIRSGPGISYAILGAFAFGTQIQVESISNGWATINHGGATAYVSSQYITEGNSENNTETVAPSTGFTIQAVFVRENWNGDGKDIVLDCGQFSLDAVTAEGPPSTVAIKATALPYGTRIRQTKKSKAWESVTLSLVASEIAAAGGMTCLYESSSDPFYDRLEQVLTSDIEFLQTLCHNAGISLKVTNNIIVLFDQVEYESKPPVFDIKRGDGKYLKWRLMSGETDTKFTSCRVSYTDPATGSQIEGIAYIEDYKADGKNNQQLEVSAKVVSIADAKTLAEKRLRLVNKYGLTAQFTYPGNPDLMAGLTVTLSDWGMWSGKYIIAQAQHTVDNSGYRTQLRLRRVLEGY